MRTLLCLALLFVSCSAYALSPVQSCPKLSGVYGNADLTLTVKQKTCKSVTIKTEVTDDYEDTNTQYITPDGVTESQDEDDTDRTSVIVYSYGTEAFENNVQALIGHYSVVDTDGNHTEMTGHFRIVYFVNAQGQLVIAQLADQDGALVMNGQNVYDPKTATP